MGQIGYSLLLVVAASSCHETTRGAPLPSATSRRPAIAAQQSAAAQVTPGATEIPVTPTASGASTAARASARISAAPVELTQRRVRKLIAGPQGKKCRYDIEYPEIRAADTTLERAVNQRLAPEVSDFHCTADDIVWDGDNGLSGNGEPAPKIFERTSRYQVHYNDRQLLAVALTLWADTGTAHGASLRDEVVVLDLAAGGRPLPLSEVIDQKRDPERWASRVGDAVKRALAPDATFVEWVTNVTVEVDRYVVSSVGIALCPSNFPSALAALATCSYTLYWSELAPFWIAGNPLERAKNP